MRVAVDEAGQKRRLGKVEAARPRAQSKHHVTGPAGRDPSLLDRYGPIRDRRRTDGDDPASREDANPPSRQGISPMAASLQASFAR